MLHVIVTGANGGLGRLIVKTLIRDGHGVIATMRDIAEQMLKAFEKNFEGPSAPDPQWVADAVSELIKKPRGKRPFRTVVDRLGMGAAVEPYNKAADELQRGLFTAFGMADTLKLKI